MTNKKYKFRHPRIPFRDCGHEHSTERDAFICGRNTGDDWMAFWQHGQLAVSDDNGKTWRPLLWGEGSEAFVGDWWNDSQVDRMIRESDPDKPAPRHFEEMPLMRNGYSRPSLGSDHKYGHNISRFSGSNSNL